MARASDNDIFLKTSFLYGGNAAYLEDLEARYEQNPSSVDEGWRSFFAALKEEKGDALKNAKGASWKQPGWPLQMNGELVAALDGNWIEVEKTVGQKIKAEAKPRGVELTSEEVQQATRDSVKALMMIRAYRMRGHLHAKLDPLDFVLWKHAKPGEPSWESPWGAGRPGWHIECSAMSTSLLGSYFDLHGGGEDLKFPHHENEIAQSCAACDAPFVRLWMHNGFVRVNEVKMSKSLGNFFTVREVLKTLRDPEVLRFFLLSSHYRGPINYSAAQLAQADETLLGLYRALKDAAPEGSADPEDAARFRAAMDDDFNTPEAFAVLQGVARMVNQAKAAGDLRGASKAAATLRELGGTLGVLQQDPDSYLKRSAGASSLTDEEVETQLSERRAARAARNFAESDRIRDLLSGAGILLEDKPGGRTEWRRA